MSEIKRLYQPNLTLAYDVCKTDDNNMWTLVVRNHEDIGIIDEQFIRELWAFANVFTNRLIESKMFKLEEEDRIPDAGVVVTHNMRFTIYNIVFHAMDKQITNSTFGVLVGELAKNLAEQAKIDLTKPMNTGMNDARI